MRIRNSAFESKLRVPENMKFSRRKSLFENFLRFLSKFLYLRRKSDHAVYHVFFIFFKWFPSFYFRSSFSLKKLKTCRRKSRKIWNETFWVFVNSVRICNRRDQKGFGGPFSSRPDSDSISLGPHYATILLKKNVSQVSKTNSRIRKFLIICSYGMS